MFLEAILPLLFCPLQSMLHNFRSRATAQLPCIVVYHTLISLRANMKARVVASRCCACSASLLQSLRFQDLPPLAHHIFWDSLVDSLGTFVSLQQHLEQVRCLPGWLWKHLEPKGPTQAAAATAPSPHSLLLLQLRLQPQKGCSHLLGWRLFHLLLSASPLRPMQRLNQQPAVLLQKFAQMLPFALSLQTASGEKLLQQPLE